MAEACGRNPYLVPRLYVEGVASDEYLLVEGDEARVLSRCSGPRCLGKTIYGSSIDFVDLEAKRASRSFAVVLPPEYTEALYVEKGSPLEPIPYEGVRVSMEVCEGSKVERWGTLAFLLTGKHEMRRLKSHVKGIVVYIYSSPLGARENGIILIAPEEVVRRVHVQRNAG